jgi:hypothetical protein
MGGKLMSETETLVGRTVCTSITGNEQRHRVIHVSGGRLITIRDDGEICGIDPGVENIKLDSATERSVVDLHKESDATQRLLIELMNERPVIDGIRAVRVTGASANGINAALKRVAQDKGTT